MVYKQLHYIQTKDIGFNKNQVLVIDGTGNLGNNVQAFKNEVLNMPGVISGTLSSFLPVTNSSRSDNTWSKDAVSSTTNSLDMQNWKIDYDYIKTMGMKIKEGRNFSKDFAGDSSAVIINETTEKILGYKDPIGQRIYTTHYGSDSMVPYTIVGVVKNFNYQTLHHQVGPLAFTLNNNPYTASFKINTSNIQGLITQIRSKWKSMASGIPFSYRFLNESFNEMYRAEQRAGTIALIFSVLAIFIACLGLFGLATFIAEQRTKEIGIRKVLGASVREL